MRSILNTTTQLGWLSRSLKVQNSSGPSLSANIDGTLAGGRFRRLPARDTALNNPHGYYIKLTTSSNPNGALHDQLENPQKH